MDLKLLFLGLVIVSSGCVSQSSTPEQTNQVQVETVDINGIGGDRTVESPNPVILNVNGQDFEVFVEDGTEVREINSNGINVDISLPAGSDPEISQNGENVDISRR